MGEYKRKWDSAHVAITVALALLGPVAGFGLSKMDFVYKQAIAVKTLQDWRKSHEEVSNKYISMIEHQDQHFIEIERRLTRIENKIDTDISERIKLRNEAEGILSDKKTS